MANDRYDFYVRAVFLTALVVSIFTGIGNMPMWGRFFVADIPGFGWSGDFFINIYVHYLSGAVLLMIATYHIIFYAWRTSRHMRLSSSGLIRGALLGLTLVSGIFSAFKNLPFINLTMAVLVVLVIAHLGAALAYLFFSIACGFLKKPWLTGR